LSNGKAAGGTRATKAERKEQARRQRIELQRRMARTRRNRRMVTAAVGVAALVGVAVLALTSGNGGRRSDTGSLAGMMTGSQPWPSNTADLAGRLGALSLPPVGGAIHIHSHLDISIDGAPVSLPADIGISPAAESPLHTHDATGVIHLESADANATFTLGEFFDVWGLKLTPTCIGGYCDSGGKTVRVFVGGRAYQGDPRSIVLKDHEEIVVAYGSQSQVPDPLPTFDWSTLNP
jgi:hypothetical protein